MTSPQKKLFDTVFGLLISQGYTVYDFLPLEDEPVKYPIVVMGATQQTSAMTKYSRNDHVFLTIDVWGSKKQRKVVSDIADYVYNLGIGYIKTDEYTFYGQTNQQNLEMSIDTSVPNTTYQRATIKLELTII